MNAFADAAAQRIQRTRAFGLLMIAGGVLAGITVALPPAATNSDAAVIVLGAEPVRT